METDAGVSEHPVSVAVDVHGLFRATPHGGTRAVTVALFLA